MSETSIVERAYADLEARQKEADALNRGERPNAGTFRSRAEFEEKGGEARTEAAAEAVSRAAGSVAREIMEGTKDAPAAVPVGLAGRQFRAFFASDVQARKIEFEIDGNPAAVWVRKLNPDDYDALLDLFMQIAASQKANGGTPDLALVREMNRFLVPRAVTRAELWRREGDAWAQVSLPEGQEARREFIEREFQCSPEVWQGLVVECLNEQGLGANQGN